MTGDRKIVGIRPPADEMPIASKAEGPAGPPPLPEASEPLLVEDDTQVPAEHERFSDALGWVVHAGALLWVAFTLWSGTAGFSSTPTGTGWLELGGAILPPLLLWATAAVLLRRSSIRAHHGQLRLLRALSSEYGELDHRLAAMQLHWREADQELQSRAMALSGYGLDAATRLRDAGQNIETVMQRCTDAAAALAAQGEAGQRQLESLALAVPRLEEITARLSDNLRQAGQVAYQFGGQLEAQIANLGIEAATTGAALSEASEALTDRVATLGESSTHTEAVLAASAAQLGTAAAEQRDQSLALLADYAASASETTSEAVAKLAAARAAARVEEERDAATLQLLLEQVRGATGQLKATLDDAATSTSALHDALTEQVQTIRDQLAIVESDGRARMAGIQEALALLSQGMTAFASSAQDGDDRAVALIDRAQTLLIALDATSREIDQTIPEALTRLTGHVASAEAMIGQLAPLTEAESARVAAIEQRLQSISGTLAAQQDRIGAINSSSDAALSARQAELTAIEAGLASVEQRIAAMAEGPVAELSSRLAAVEDEAGATLGRTEAAIARLVHSASEQAASDIGAAIDRVAGAGINERLAAMSAHADQAVAAAAAASDRLMRQLITIADSSAALEQRAADVAALSGDVERETLARQMALLGEALQSTAVDLTRILDSDVADQAWEAYLKGDRSIFARRAARLLSYGEARDLLRRYESDETFKAQVNRYIHDFEAMLRGVMDTRDGHALSVTLLSSDIGKLYVALAQAIERLRR